MLQEPAIIIGRTYEWLQGALKDLNIPYNKNQIVSGELTVRGGYLLRNNCLLQDIILAIFVRMIRWR